MLIPSAGLGLFNFVLKKKVQTEIEASHDHTTNRAVTTSERLNAHDKNKGQYALVEMLPSARRCFLR